MRRLKELDLQFARKIQTLYNGGQYRTEVARADLIIGAVLVLARPRPAGHPGHDRNPCGRARRR